MRSVVAALCAAVILSLFSASLRAHEGHDHGPQPPVPVADASPRAEVSSDAFELVAVARGDALDIYLDRFASNEPVRGATIEVETPQGPAPAAAVADGVYRLAAPWAGAPGRYDLIFTVTAGDTTDILPVSLVIPDDHAATSSGGTLLSPSAIAQSARRVLPQRADVLAVGVLAFGLGIVATIVFRRRRDVGAAGVVLAAVLISFGADAHEGHDHGDEKKAITAPAGNSELARRLPDGSVYVPKKLQRLFAVRTVLTADDTHRRAVELPGRIIPDPNASGFVQSAIGGRLTAPAGGFPRLGAAVKAGEVVAYVTPPLQAIDVSDMRQRLGELDQQISIVERRLVRFEQLAPSGAVARSQLEDTRLELQGLKERKASLEQSRREPEALIAPVSGVIAEGTPVAGQMAQPNGVVFHIVDPAKLWVEALSFDAISATQSASATAPNGRSFPLRFRGSGFADRSQSVPVHFAIEGDTAGLRAGQFVTVTVTTQSEMKGVAVPRTSLVRASNGQDFVFEHVSAERFEARPVRVEPLDADRVLIAAGTGAGKRIVTQGAELLDHVR
jgi:cobalt-zinc-cadmium efflux system membrane fusion protein